jgi:hypothetical protein
MSPGTEESRDWPSQAADAIVDVVDRVRDQTTGRAVVAARAIVFGIVISVLATIGFVTLLIGIVRGTQVFIAWIAGLAGYDMPHAQAVYLSYLIVGAAFTAAGAVLWRMANRRAVGVGGEASADLEGSA